MATAELTELQVIQALDHFHKEGNDNPGQLKLLDYIRSQGGGGSIPRLKKLLHLLEHKKQIALAGLNIKPLPDPLSQMATKLFDEMSSLLEEKELGVESAAKSAIETADNARTEALYTLSEKEQESQRLTLDITKLQKQIQNNDLLNIQHEQQTKLLQHELDNANDKMSLLESRVDDFKSALAKEAKEASSRESLLNKQLENERQRNVTTQKDYESRLATQKDELTTKLASQKDEYESNLSDKRETILSQETVFNSAKQDFNRQLKEKNVLINDNGEQLNEQAILITDKEREMSLQNTQIATLTTKVELLNKQVNDGIKEREKLTTILKKQKK